MTFDIEKMLEASMPLRHGYLGERDAHVGTGVFLTSHARSPKEKNLSVPAYNALPGQGLDWPLLLVIQENARLHQRGSNVLIDEHCIL